MDYESNEFITMKFPKNNNIFGKFMNKTFEEQETIIKLGTIMEETGKDSKLTLNSEEWAEKLNAIKKIKDEKINNYNEKIKEYKTTIIQIKDDNREEVKNSIKEAREKEKTRYESLLLTAQEHSLEFQNEIERLKKEKWELSDKIRKESDDKIERIRENTRVYQEKREEEYKNTMMDMAEKMNNADDKCKVASNKGKEGETTVKQFLVMSLPKSDIIDVAQQGGAGDLIIRDASKNVMVEVKNYDSCNVKTSEVNKFKKDMKNNKFTGGIFLSMKRGICNIDNWTMETIDGRPVIFLTYAAKNMENIITAYKIIYKLSEIHIDWTITEKLNKIENFTKQYVKEKKKKLKMVSKFSTDMTNLINGDEERLNTLIDTLKS
jgi:hypothetical protein